MKPWCFTLNNPTLGKKDMRAIFEPKCAYWVYQLEEGENETLHFQGYVYMKNRKRLSYMRKLLPRAHWEAAKGSPAENRKYCTKEKGHCQGPWTGGEFPALTQGRRNDLEELLTAIKAGSSDTNLFESHTSCAFKYQRGIDKAKGLYQPDLPEDWQPDVRLYFGDPGLGKTWSVHREFKKHELYSTPLGNGLWFDGIDYGHKACLIDDFTGQIALTQFLRLIDRYWVQVPIKGGFRWFRPNTIVIASNLHPQQWYKETAYGDERRVLYKAMCRRVTEVRHYLERDDPRLQIEGFILDEDDQEMSSTADDNYIVYNTKEEIQTFFNIHKTQYL